MDLDKIHLEIEEPKRLSPSIMIYGMEEKEELKEDFIKKNFDRRIRLNSTIKLNFVIVLKLKKIV